MEVAYRIDLKRDLEQPAERMWNAVESLHTYTKSLDTSDTIADDALDLADAYMDLLNQIDCNAFSSIVQFYRDAGSRRAAIDSLAAHLRLRLDRDVIAMSLIDAFCDPFPSWWHHVETVALANSDGGLI